MNTLADQIALKLKKMNIPVATAEKKAGIYTGGITKILSGISSNPRLDTLIGLKKLFNCSIEELVFSDVFVAKIALNSSIDPKSIHAPFDVSFFIKILESVQKAQKALKKNLTPKEFLETAIESYFLLWQKDHPIDDFVALLLQKNTRN
jgi:hypothetical protein